MTGKVVVLVAALGISSVPLVARPTTTVVEAWAATSGGDCILACYGSGAVGTQCIPGPQEHFAPQHGDTHMYGGGWHNTCFSGTCDQQHPYCAQTFAALDDLRRTIRSGASRADFVVLAARHAKVASLEEGVFAMYGCDGNLVAQIPLEAVGAD